MLKGKLIGVCAALIALSLLICAAFAEDGWTCSSCGRINPEKANFCGECSSPRPTTRYVADTIANAWVCESCGSVCPKEDSFCIFCGSKNNSFIYNALLIYPAVMYQTEFANAEIDTVSDTINTKREEKSFGYTAPVDGTYRVWLENVMNGVSFRVSVADANGKELNHDYLGGGKGLSVKLQAEKVYKVTVAQSTNTGSFTLHLGVPNETREIGENQMIRDNICFIDQNNLYSFVAPEDGAYRFWVENVKAGVRFKLSLDDALGYNKNYDYVSNGGGINATLKKGEEYLLSVQQSSELGDYMLCVGLAKQTAEISGCDAIGDEIYFIGQDNTYTFTAPDSGEYSFTITAAENGLKFEVDVYDLDGYRIEYDHLSKNQGFSVKLEASNEYIIHVAQSTGTGDYTLTIKYPDR